MSSFIHTSFNSLNWSAHTGSKSSNLTLNVKAETQWSAVGQCQATWSVLLTLLAPPSVAFWPIEHVESVVESVCERDHCDCPFSLANQCMRRKTVLTEASKRNSSESGVKASTICISAVLALLVSPFEWHIQTTAICWFGELFPFMQVHNVRAIWRLTVMWCVENATFWPKTGD